jgi:ribokinase
MSGSVLVLGSINLDVVVLATRLPAPGETVLGGELQRHPGGKGANQAVAAARSGAAVRMIGAVGDDAEGRIGLDALAREGVEITGVARLDGPSGVAIIAVDPDGQNQIVVAPGANSRVDADAVERALASAGPRAGDVLLASLEVPLASVERACMIAAAQGATVVVNPAPAAPLPATVLDAGPILTPNRSELAALSGESEIAAGARELLARGARVAVTLGPEGCLLVDASGRILLPARSPEHVIDTTGAGDTFSGVLAGWLAEGSDLANAVRAANAAAGLSVRAAGARSGMPRRDEIEAALVSA